MLTNKESLSIIRAVTGLGDSLGMITIAEGVETPDQLNLLREEGCNEVQGYLFSATAGQRSACADRSVPETSAR